MKETPQAPDSSPPAVKPACACPPGALPHAGTVFPSLSSALLLSAALLTATALSTASALLHSFALLPAIGLLLAMGFQLSYSLSLPAALLLASGFARLPAPAKSLGLAQALDLSAAYALGPALAPCPEPPLRRRRDRSLQPVAICVDAAPASLDRPDDRSSAISSCSIPPAMPGSYSNLCPNDRVIPRFGRKR